MKFQRIEKSIADLVAAMMRTAVALPCQAENRKQREAEEQKRAKERVQLQKDIQEEEKKLEQFDKGLTSGNALSD